jgi:phage tail sheath protein FI
MAYMHGVYILESPTPLQVPVPVDSALPVAVGVAPVHKLENPAAAVNNPSLSFSYGEGAADMGYSDDWKKFPLSEVLYSQMRVHAISPLVLINVWNPIPTAQEVAVTDLPVINGIATINDAMAMISGVRVHNVDVGSPDYVRNKDYSLKYDGDKLLITIIKDEDIPLGTTTMSVTYKQASVDAITKADIAGGIDQETNKRTGMELITEVFLAFRKITGFILAPRWSHDPEIYALMCSKAKNLGYGFTCIALADLPTTGQYANYRKLPEWKNNNSYVDIYSFLTWPCVAIGDRVFHGSTRMAAMYGEVDNRNGGLPYEQASNKTLSMTSMCDEDGNVIPMLSEEQANYLNENGIGTFINFDGWRAWGVETAAYPGNTDIKDFERGVRRMFSYVENVVNRTMRQNVDRPITRLLIDSVLLTANEYLNTLKSRNAIIGGFVEFLRADNNNQSIMSGQLLFATHLTPPNAAKALTYKFIYDPDLLDGLFE